MEDLASLFVAAAGIYTVLGLLFAIAFVLFGASRIDPAAREGSLGFRLLVFPGCVALWPILARRWWSGSPPPEENNAHRAAARSPGGGG